MTSANHMHGKAGFQKKTQKIHYKCTIAECILLFFSPFSLTLVFLQHTPPFPHIRVAITGDQCSNESH